MVCPRCGCENVTIINEQTSAKTKTKKMGCLWTIGRWALILMTGGLWWFIGKRKSSSKTKFKNQTYAVCQNCGNKWRV